MRPGVLAFLGVPAVVVLVAMMAIAFWCSNLGVLWRSVFQSWRSGVLGMHCRNAWRSGVPVGPAFED